MIRYGHTFLSIGCERPEELTREEYNNWLVEMVEERLSRDWIKPLQREDLTNLFNLLNQNPPSNGVYIYVDSMSMIRDVKFIYGWKEKLSEGMYKELLRHSPSSLHPRLLQEFRRGSVDGARGAGEAGERGGRVVLSPCHADAEADHVLAQCGELLQEDARRGSRATSYKVPHALQERAMGR